MFTRAKLFSNSVNTILTRQCSPLNQNAKQRKRGAIEIMLSWRSFALTVVVGGPLTAYFAYEKHRLSKAREEKKALSLGVPDIGGPFSLIDHDGYPLTSAQLLGKHVILYFGFSYCPDICPTELKKLSKAFENLATKHNIEQDELQPVFITLDPWRDTVDQTKLYIKEFSPRFIGLTGTPAQIEKVCKNYRIYSSKAGSDDDYLMDHSVFSYLIDEKGKLVSYFSSADDVETIEDKILGHLRPDANYQPMYQVILDWFSSEKKETSNKEPTS